MARVVNHLIATDDSDMMVMSMLRGHDLQDSLVDQAAVPGAHPDLLAGPFAHIVVDEGDPIFEATSRVRSLTPELSKGLEFDLVVLVDPHTFGNGIEGAVAATSR